VCSIRWCTRPARQPKENPLHNNFTNLYAAVGTALALCTIAGVRVSAAPAPIPAFITAAVAEPTRPDRDRQRDGDRKLEQVLDFAGIRPRDRIGELIPGGGYFTRVLTGRL
jgi:predicted methyltransferase